MSQIGIALSGGGARGAAHIGVLHALNEHNIYPNHVSGSSAGSIVGALYCNGYKPLEILEMFNGHSFLKIFKIGVINKGFMELTHLKTFLLEHLKTNDFETLETPLYICVSNINSGTFEIISTGQITQFVLASCALPLLFKPVIIDNKTYVDGGLLNNLPIEPLLQRCDKIIGVSLCPHEKRSEVIGWRNIGNRCFQLAIWNNMQHRLLQCNLAIEIIDSYKYGMFDIKKSEELFKIGYETTLSKLPEILKKING